MQQISFAIGHALEATFTILPALGWLPPLAFVALLMFGWVYWQMMQVRYNRKARENGTLA